MFRNLIIVINLVMGLFATGAAASQLSSAHDFSFASIEGGSINLADYKGKAILLVNTASFCGFTKQYADLQKIWDSYGEKGLVVLAVPSNDFGAQEPGSKDDIKQFCQMQYGIDFPITEKEHVKGADAHPFYKWARQELGMVAAPKWNFHKYLIGPDGKLVDWFSTVTAPNAPKVIQAIEKLLKPGTH